MKNKPIPENFDEVILESGIKVKPVYGPEDIAEVEFEEKIGRPGQYPFTRGIHPYMYRQRPWTMRQYSGFGTAEETNERFKWLLSQGQTALNVAFDLPTQMGLDSDDPLAEEEVGRVGMAIDTLKDLEKAFLGIPILKISTSLTINPVASVLLAMYLAVAEKQGIPWDEVRGTTQNDILKEYIGRGTGRILLPERTQVQSLQRLRLPHQGIRRHSSPGDGLRFFHCHRLYRRNSLSRA